MESVLVTDLAGTISIRSAGAELDLPSSIARPGRSVAGCERTWINEGLGHAGTTAALDRALARAQSWFSLLNGLCGISRRLCRAMNGRAAQERIVSSEY